MPAGPSISSPNIPRHGGVLVTYADNSQDTGAHTTHKWIQSSTRTRVLWPRLPDSDEGADHQWKISSSPWQMPSSTHKRSSPTTYLGGVFPLWSSLPWAGLCPVLMPHWGQRLFPWVLAALPLSASPCVPLWCGGNPRAASACGKSGQVQLCVSLK